MINLLTEDDEQRSPGITTTSEKFVHSATYLSMPVVYNIIMIQLARFGLVWRGKPVIKARLVLDSICTFYNSFLLFEDGQVPTAAVDSEER